MDLETGRPTGETSPNDSVIKDAYEFEGNYRPNIMPTETDLDEDLRIAYDNSVYNGHDSLKLTNRNTPYLGEKDLYYM